MFALNGVYHAETECAKDAYKYMSSCDLVLGVPSHGIDYYPPPSKELTIGMSKTTCNGALTLFLILLTRKPAAIDTLLFCDENNPRTLSKMPIINFIYI